MRLNSVENIDCWLEGDGGCCTQGSLLLGEGVKHSPYNISKL